MIEYKCDAWGKLISITGALIASLDELNLFWYRGDVWDTESEYQKAVWNPTIGKCREIIDTP